MTDKFIPGQMYKDREGREYMFVGYAPNAAPLSQAIFTRDKQIVVRDLQGKAFNSEYDIPITKDVWVNVYRDIGLSTGVRCISATYDSEERAKFAATCSRLPGYLFSQKITVKV